MEFPGINQKRDHVLIASIILITGLGLVILYSSSYAFAYRRTGNGTFFFDRQVQYVCAGFVLFIISSFINLEWLRHKGIMLAMVMLTAIFCLLPFIPFFAARPVNSESMSEAALMQNALVNSARWIGIGGRTFQPSELMKLTLPLYLAHFFDKKKDEINNLARSIIPPAIITGMFAGIILLQNNFSTAIFLVLNAIFMFFLAGIRFRYFFSAVFMVLPFAAIHIMNSEYRILRILSYVIPQYEPLGASYQVNSSMSAINSGGFWGAGIGQGIRKIVSVPEIHSDFIFASYAEEMGFLGVILFCLLFGVFAVRGYISSLRNESPFYRLLGCGLVTMIISQVILNISVVAGALPATGIPLPFFSAGGSSLIVSMIMAGLIVNISRNNKNKTADNIIFDKRGEN